ncbi:hypothetical protein GOV12_06110 [Candidatus Pacearchaeota archaeon]|nr:hypothetical protein [Candidatus Pacearchaeota archaeon]
MTTGKLVLDLIVANSIEDSPNGLYVKRFNHGFMFDFLSDDDQTKLFQDGVAGSYAIVKKRRDGEVGIAQAYFAIPIYIKGDGFSSINCPVLISAYTDDQLHEHLPFAISRINEKVSEFGNNGLVIATETGEALVVQKCFEELDYDVHVFQRVDGK